MKKILNFGAVVMFFTLLLSAGFVSCKKEPKPEEVKVTSLVINNDVTSVEVGETVTLSYTVLPAEAASLPATWTSSEAATVDNDGNVTGVSAGMANINVTVGGVMASTTIKVTEPVAEFMVVAAGQTKETTGAITCGVAWYGSKVAIPQISATNSFSAVVYDPTNKLFYFGGTTASAHSSSTAFVYKTSNFEDWTQLNLSVILGGVSTVTSMFFGKDGVLYSAGSNAGRPVYWTETVRTGMSSGSTWTGPNNSIYVEDGKVYTCGTNTNGLMWAAQNINGEPEDLDAQNSAAYGITVYNGTPYMCGQTAQRVKFHPACIWCGKDITTINSGDNNIALAYSIRSCGDGSFVVGGYVESVDGKRSPVIWIGDLSKGFTISSLTNPSGIGEVRSVFVDANKNIYAGGYYVSNDDKTTKIACYWKNGELVQLGRGEKDSFVSSIIAVLK